MAEITAILRPIRPLDPNRDERHPLLGVRGAQLGEHDRSLERLPREHQEERSRVLHVVHQLPTSECDSRRERDECNLTDREFKWTDREVCPPLNRPLPSPPHVLSPQTHIARRAAHASQGSRSSGGHPLHVVEVCRIEKNEVIPRDEFDDLGAQRLDLRLCHPRRTTLHALRSNLLVRIAGIAAIVRFELCARWR